MPSSHPSGALTGMSIDSIFSILQFSDGLFPAGAYAHSFGLEYYIQSGKVRDADGVRSFIRANLTGSLGTADAVAMLAALRLAEGDDNIHSIIALDQTMEAMKPIEEVRNASRQMGRQTIRVAASLQDHSLLHSYFQAVDVDATPGHHCVCFGVIGGVMQWPRLEAAQAYLYTSSASIVAASLRLMPLGQLRGQQILWHMRPLIEKLASEVIMKREVDMSSFAPGLEIASMRHARLDARLFRS
jgi:urease accessory protein